VQVVEEIMYLDLKLCTRNTNGGPHFASVLIHYLWGHQCPNLVYFENWVLKGPLLDTMVQEEPTN